MRTVVGGGGRTCLKQNLGRVKKNQFKRLKQQGLERD